MQLSELGEGGESWIRSHTANRKRSSLAGFGGPSLLTTRQTGPVPEAAFGPLLGPHRHPRRGPARPVSEALVDRIDNERHGEPSAAIRARVEAARARQSAHFANVKDGQGASLTTNADMGPTQVPTSSRWTRPATLKVLGAAMSGRRPGDERERTGVHWHLQRQRKCHRVLMLARTIADLAGSEHIQPAHIAMSISDRPR